MMMPHKTEMAQTSQVSVEMMEPMVETTLTAVTATETVMEMTEKEMMKATTMRAPMETVMMKETAAAWMAAWPQVVLVTRAWRTSVRTTVMLAKRDVMMLVKEMMDMTEKNSATGLPDTWMKKVTVSVTVPLVVMMKTGLMLRVDWTISTQWAEWTVMNTAQLTPTMRTSKVSVSTATLWDNA